MTRRRWIVLGLVALVVAVAVPLGLRGAGEESPEAAVYGLAHALEHRDVTRVCDRLFPSTSLPASVARELGVPIGGAGNERTWEDERRDCAREFGKHGEFESFEFENPRVSKVKRIPIRPSDGVTRAATATVSLDSARAQPVKLVEYRGQWRLVFEVN